MAGSGFNEYRSETLVRSLCFDFVFLCVEKDRLKLPVNSFFLFFLTYIRNPFENQFCRAESFLGLLQAFISHTNRPLLAVVKKASKVDGKSKKPNSLERNDALRSFILCLGLDRTGVLFSPNRTLSQDEVDTLGTWTQNHFKAFLSLSIKKFNQTVLPFCFWFLS